jgi:hypothetical protein
MNGFLYKKMCCLSADEGGSVAVAKSNGMVGAVFALGIFIFGGISTFVGLGLIAFMKNRDLLGIGEGRSFGILLLCVGLLSSIFGVLIMRLVRNRV